MAGKTTVLTQFDDAARRRIAAVVRRVENEPLDPPASGGAKGQRGLQVRFGITVTHNSAYPSSPATVFNWKPLDRKPETLEVGDQEIEETAWPEGVRLGTSIGGTFLAVGTVCVAFKIGGEWWLQPIPLAACGYIPLKWSDVAGWTAGARQALMHAPDACPAWVTVAPCET